MSEKKSASGFLCPSCRYGQLSRICHEPPHYGEAVYTCVDMTKPKDAAGKPVITYHGDAAMEYPYSILDYENGPGGWDGKTCPNYTKVVPFGEQSNCIVMGLKGDENREWGSYILFVS